MIKIRDEKVILGPEDLKPSSKDFEIMGTLNPGALRLSDGRILIYVRVIERLKKTEDSRYLYSPRFSGKDDFRISIDKFPKKSTEGHSDVDISFKDGTKRLTYLSHLRRILLDESGFKILKIEQKPAFYGVSWNAELGVEDPRITKINGVYYMAYVALSRKEGVSTCLAVSKDGFTWERKGIIFGEQDKDVVIFPEKIKGRYVAFDRPEGNFEFSLPHIWIAYSKDLEYWGKLKGVFFSKKHVDFHRSGAGPPPIKTEKGWLFIFHGVTKSHHKEFLEGIKKFLGIKIKQGEEIYAAWAALLDLNNPRKILARSHFPILYPRRAHDVSFEGKKVIFPTGLVEDLNGKDILLYSGAGDTYTSVKRIRISDLLDSMEAV
jgi:predicted GH43/DUF377 family glycosyl hydrolase